MNLFAHPVSGNIPWRDIEALLIELGAEISEREGSRVLVRLFLENGAFSTVLILRLQPTKALSPAFATGLTTTR